MPNAGNRSVVPQSWSVAGLITSGNQGYQSPLTIECPHTTDMLMPPARWVMQFWLSTYDPPFWAFQPPSGWGSRLFPATIPVRLRLARSGADERIRIAPLCYSLTGGRQESSDLFALIRISTFLFITSVLRVSRH